MTQMYRIAGSFFEVCNCNAICPCRTRDGVDGGRSTHGICDYILTWKIVEGHFKNTDLGGLSISIAGSYNDDVEEGVPWNAIFYIDDTASEEQFNSLARIFQGNAGGDMLFTDWTPTVLGIRRAKIELDHTPGGEEVRIADTVSAKVERVFEHDEVLTTGISGHQFPGQECVSNFRVADGDFHWDYKERCGFSSKFEYQG